MTAILDTPLLPHFTVTTSRAAHIAEHVFIDGSASQAHQTTTLQTQTLLVRYQGDADTLHSALLRMSADHHAARLTRSSQGLCLAPTLTPLIEICDFEDIGDLDHNDLLLLFHEHQEAMPFPTTGPRWQAAILSQNGDIFAVALSADAHDIPLSALRAMSDALTNGTHAATDHSAWLSHCARTLAPFDQANQLPYRSANAAGPKTIFTELPPHFDTLLSSNAQRASQVAHIAWAITLARLSHAPHAVFGSYDHRLPDGLPAPICFEFNGLTTVSEIEASYLVQSALFTHGLNPSLAQLRDYLHLPDGLSLFKTTLSTTTPLPQANAEDEDCAIFVGPNSIQAQFGPFYSRDAARRILEYFGTTLESVLKASSDATLRTITTLPASECQETLSIGNCATSEVSSLDMVDILEAQSRATPEAPALSQMGREGAPMSYAQLDDASNQMAHALRARGVRAGDVVAICLERSPAFIISMFGILKAGGIYVPVDPAYPRANKEHMQTDSGAKYVITQDGIETAPSVPALMAHDLMAEDHPKTPLMDRPTDPDRVAYMIYTSGTTGKPKGVVTTHRGTISHALAILTPYNFAQNHIVMQCSSMSFDVSVSEILGAYLTGAHLVLRNDAFLQDIDACIALLAKYEIAIAMLPMAFWCVLTEEMHRTGKRLPATLKSVIVGGERATPNILAKWREVTKDVRWINAYGPTETAVYATIYIEDELWDPSKEVPIGRPLDQCNVHILCYDGTLAPLGVKGFLWISGVCVAQGYHNRPELTHEKFHDGTGRIDPHLPENRYYNTGDVAMWNMDRNLDFFGRIDRQVQVRGFRVELPAIERALESHQNVERTMVATLNEGTTAARLVAFVQVKDPERPLNEDELRDMAADYVPRNIAPAIHIVPDYPKTPNGKVDMLALIAMVDHPTEQGSDATPADPVVAQLCTLFAAVLGMERFDPNMSFFGHGGHSLLALRLVSMIDQSFGKRLTVAQLINHPSPAQAAQLMASSSEASNMITNIQPNGTGIPIYGLHVLGSLGEFYQGIAGHLGPNQPLFGLTILGSEHEDRATSIDEICTLYADQIDSHAPKDQAVILAGVSLGGVFALTVAQILHDRGRDVAHVILFDTDGPTGRRYAPKITRMARHLGYFATAPIAYTRHYLSHRAYNYVETPWVRERLIPWLDPEMGQHYKDLIRHRDLISANETLSAAHEPPRYQGAVSYIHADLYSMEDPAAVSEAFGWRIYCPNLTYYRIPTTHLGLFYPPFDAQTAQVIRTALGAAS